MSWNNSFLRFTENAQSLFARPSLYVKLDLQFVRQLNSIGTDYGLLITIKGNLHFNKKIALNHRK